MYPYFRKFAWQIGFTKTTLYRAQRCMTHGLVPVSGTNTLAYSRAEIRFPGSLLAANALVFAYMSADHIALKCRSGARGRGLVYVKSIFQLKIERETA